jgi:hypothetical protein
VPPTLVRLTRRALEGGPVAPSNPLLMTLQGQTVTSGRRERHPHRCQSCAAIPAPAAPRRALLQQLRRCWARGDGTPPQLPLYLVRITVDGSLEPAWRRPDQPLRLYPRGCPCSKYRARHDAMTGETFGRTTVNSSAMYTIPLHVAK